MIGSRGFAQRGHFEGFLRIEVQHQPQLIAKLLREAAGLESIENGRCKSVDLLACELTMLKPTAHHCAGAAMPVPTGFRLDECHALLDAFRRVFEQCVCQGMKFLLRQRIKA